MNNFKPHPVSMNLFLFIPLFTLSLQRVVCETQTLGGASHASSPPRGWNSYDSFCWTISEGEFLQNAQLVKQRLHDHGYEYVVVDYLWYRRLVPGAYVDSLGYDVIDEWGRVIPDPGRWPSSTGEKGFSEVAKKVHDMGLKFGIHVMRGISTQAVNANTPILDTSTGKAYLENGRKWYARDIGLKEKTCAWMRNGFMSVNTSLGAGKAFLRSLYQQYAEWNVDFVKHDCVFGDDLDVSEISYVSEVLKTLNRPILYSLSPGTSATPSMAKEINSFVNMYRVTGDDWDTWGDVASHFDVARYFSGANLIGAGGLLGNSWPDLDMLPLGWLTDPGSNDGPHRPSKLNLQEQQTQMTLWAMARSPLMFGGDMRKLDETTFTLITNPTLMEINSYSSDNMEFPYITVVKDFRVRSDEGLNFQTKSLKDGSNTERIVLRFTSCKDDQARGWFVKDLDSKSEQVCWREYSRTDHRQPFCLYKRQPLLESDEEGETYSQEYAGKIHLLATEEGGFCFDASSKRKLTSKELRRGSFSPCRQEASQMWELNRNGTLVNSYSGLCAFMKVSKANAGSDGGARSWIATGREGEVYVALFNLNSEAAVISTTVSGLSMALPNKNLTSCSCKEVWGGKDYGKVKDSLSVPVLVHGCALLVFSCD